MEDKGAPARCAAFPQAASAFKDAAPIIGEARPYTTDFLGWLDNFSTTGGGFDALGAYARAFIGFGENLTAWCQGAGRWRSRPATADDRYPAAPMKYRHLGASGLRVSEIALGSWLTYGGTVEDQSAVACIRRAFELGVNFFDTANVYRRGEAERVVGRALEGIERDDYVLATKVYFPMGEGPNDRGLSRKHVMEQCERSLKRLGVDYVDLYQCHRPDPDTPLAETLRALDDLVRQGKVLYVGVSEWPAELIDEARRIQDERGYDPIVSNQPQYSMLYRAIETEVIPLCKQLGIGQVVWSPIAQGVLTGKYAPGDEPPEGSRATGPDAGFMQSFMRADVLEAVQRLRPIADGLGVTMAQLAIAWVLREENVSSAIVGASRPDQVDENVAASGVELGDDVLRAIEEALGPIVME